MVFRYLATAILVPALLAGCSQSLFVDGSGDGGRDRPDSGLDEDPDAGAPILDAAPVTDPDGGGNEPDATPASPDAAPREDCRLPCAGDAFDNFFFTPGGSSRWRYVEVQPELMDAPYADMTTTVFTSGVAAWQGTGTSPPSVAMCVMPETEAPCLELQDTLALTTPGNAAGAHLPGLMFIAPETGLYYLNGHWRVSSLAPAVETTMRFSLNRHNGTIEQENVVLATTPYQFAELEIVLQAGDQLVLSAIATTGESVSVGVNLYVTGPF